tara:strand:- start:104 stop:529 length:426 start_codon:yes stop_codon:yes gene_type:complete
MENYQSGGRTRNIVNVANVGGAGTVANTFTAVSSAPSAATDGYANYGTQKMLHVVTQNNNTDGTDVKIVIWGYHSFSGIWAKINIFDGNDGKSQPLIIETVKEVSHHCFVNIEGIERVAVQCHSYSGTGAGMKVWLGVNTI